MKKIIFLVLLSSSFILAKAQHTRLNVTAAYAFDDSYDSYYDPYNYYNGKINGGLQLGASLEYLPQHHYGFELSYLNQNTHAPTHYQEGASFGAKYTDFNLHINYIMVGGNRYQTTSNGKVEGYGGFSLGVAIVNADNPDNGNSASATKFAWAIKLGCNIWLSPKVGIKLQTQLYSIAQGAGGGLYFGTGGAGVGVSTYSSIYQFGLGGGLTFKLGK